MPTAPDPNSPYPAAQLQSTFGLRTPGTPSSVGKPGVQQADVSFPAPPSVATAPNGRPPNPGIPSPTPSALGGAPPPPAPPTQPPATPSGAASEAPPAGGAQGQQGQEGQPLPSVPPPLTTPTISAANGEPRHTLTPEGDARYREKVLQLRTSMGPVPSIFRNPNLPQMPAEIGKMNFNPFTNQYIQG